jgi:hypothetical protein
MVRNVNWAMPHEAFDAATARHLSPGAQGRMDRRPCRLVAADQYLSVNLPSTPWDLGLVRPCFSFVRRIDCCKS